MMQNNQKRRRIFDNDDPSPIRQVQKYCSNNSLVFDEETKQHFLKQLQEKQEKLKSIEITFKEDEIDQFRVYTLNQLNQSATKFQKQINKIQIKEVDQKSFEEKALEIQNKITSKHNHYQKDIDKMNKMIENKIDQTQLLELLKLPQVPPTCVTKLTHQGFLETCQSEIQQYQQQLQNQLQSYEKQLHPPPTSDLQALNQMLESVSTYDEIQCNCIELDKQMTEFQRQLEIQY